MRWFTARHSCTVRQSVPFGIAQMSGSRSLSPGAARGKKPDGKERKSPYNEQNQEIQIPVLKEIQNLQD